MLNEANYLRKQTVERIKPASVNMLLNTNPNMLQSKEASVDKRLVSRGNPSQAVVLQNTATTMTGHRACKIGAKCLH